MTTPIRNPKVSASCMSLGTHRVQFGREANTANYFAHLGEMQSAAGGLTTEAINIGFGSIDTAPLYMADELIVAALNSMMIEPKDRRIFTKVGRLLRPACGKPFAQPEAFRKALLPPFGGLIDQFDWSEAGILAQAGSSMRTLGVSKFLGLALHDVADWFCVRKGLVNSKGAPKVRELLGSFTSWSALPWAEIESALDTLKLLKQHGITETIGLATKHPEFTLEFARRFGDRIDYIMSTFMNPVESPAAYELLELAKQQNFTIAFGGMLFGGLGCLTQDPRTFRSVAETDRAYVRNYEPATASEMAEDGKYWDLCQKHGTSMAEFFLGFAGRMMNYHPNIVTRAATSTRTPTRLQETLNMMREDRVPEGAWQDALQSGLLDQRCADFLLAA